MPASFRIITVLVNRQILRKSLWELDPLNHGFAARSVRKPECVRMAVGEHDTCAVHCDIRKSYRLNYGAISSIGEQYAK